MGAFLCCESYWEGQKFVTVSRVVHITLNFNRIGQMIGDEMNVVAVSEIATSHAVWANACLIIAFGTSLG